MATAPKKDATDSPAPDVQADAPAPTQPQADAVGGLSEAQVVAHLVTGVPIA